MRQLKPFEELMIFGDFSAYLRSTVVFWRLSMRSMLFGTTGKMHNLSLRRWASVGTFLQHTTSIVGPHPRSSGFY
jgi:hypothetical protein